MTKDDFLTDENTLAVKNKSDTKELSDKQNENAEKIVSEQIGGDHYKVMGDHQPYTALAYYLTPEQYRGYMIGTAITYLAREGLKNGDEDISKAIHTLQFYEVMRDRLYKAKNCAKFGPKWAVPSITPNKGIVVL
jgi:hypothetical protein